MDNLALGSDDDGVLTLPTKVGTGNRTALIVGVGTYKRRCGNV